MAVYEEMCIINTKKVTHVKVGVQIFLLEDKNMYFTTSKMYLRGFEKMRKGLIFMNTHKNKNGIPLNIITHVPNVKFKKDISQFIENF